MEPSQPKDPEKAKGYIERFRKPIQDLTRPFSKPISFILPEKRRVEDKLIYNDDYIKNISERLADAPGKVSYQSLVTWLSQFDTTLDKNIAFLLLSKFQYLPENEIRAYACPFLRDRLYEYLDEQGHLIQAFHDSSIEDKGENYRKWLRNQVITYAQLPQPPNTSVESQTYLWHLYETSALQGAGTSCHSSRKFRFLDEYFSKTDHQPERTVLVFMDYTNATGNQLSACIKEINKKLEKYPAWRQATYIFMYVVEMQTFSVSNELDVKEWRTLLYKDMLHYKNISILKYLEEEKISEHEYEEFVTKYSKRSGSDEIGYKNSAALTCHHYSCPNNTLPFFWKNSENWNGLFWGSQTSRGANYQRK